MARRVLLCGAFTPSRLRRNKYLLAANISAVDDIIMSYRAFSISWHVTVP